MKVPMLTSDFLDRGIDLYGDVTGVVADDGTAYTYAEFGDRVNRVANALGDAGVGPGDRVALVAGNTHYFLEVQFATNLLGAVFVPLNHRLIAPDYEYIMNDCEAVVTVADHAYADEVEAIRDEVPCDLFVGYGADRIDGGWLDYDDFVASAPPDPPERPEIGEDDDATINYTSGTTGDPKGVVRTHRTEHWHALILLHHMGITDDDTYLWTLPMFHCNGWGHTYALTGVGATHVCRRAFDPAATFERIEEYDVSYLCGAPTVLEELVEYYGEHDVEPTGDRHVRLTTAGSAPPKATIATVEEELGWELLHLYGLTETAPLIATSNSPRRLRAGDATAIKTGQGFETVGTDLRLVDESGDEVPRDGETMGEVVVRGNQVMDRYLNEPEATERAFNERLAGYFHTGDVATWDGTGMIRVQDRKQDVIVSGGENVSSIEVEDVLYDHDDVRKAAVIGVPSDEWVESIHALIVERPGADISKHEVVAYARENLATYKTPKSVEFVDDLPETATGKVRKYELREEYWEGRERRIGG